MAKIPEIEEHLTLKSSIRVVCLFVSSGYLASVWHVDDHQWIHVDSSSVNMDVDFTDGRAMWWSSGLIGYPNLGKVRSRLY